MDVPPGGGGVGWGSRDAWVDAGLVPGAVGMCHVQRGIDAGQAVSRGVGLGH